MASQLLCDLDTQQTVYVNSGPRRAGRVGPCGRGIAQQWTPHPPAPAAATGSGGPWRSEGETSDAASLLWLLDYRLDHLLSPGGAGCGQQTQHYQSQLHHQSQHQNHYHHQQHQQQHQQHQRQQQQPHYHTQQHEQLRYHPEQQPQYQHDQQQQHRQEERHRQQQTQWDAATLQTVTQDSGGTPQEQKQEVSHSNIRDAGSGKPPFTYTELIEQALMEEGQLTVSGIYRWITSHFGFYKSCDDRWKNSVRHNLSMNPYFRKGSKAGSGSGHLWTLADVEGRRARRCHTAARMGRPTHVQCDGEGAAAVEATAATELQLCEDIPSPSQEIWLCSSPPEDDPKPATPAPAVDAGFILQYCTFTPEVAATVELSQAESVDCELNNNSMGGICVGDMGESQLNPAQFRSNHQLANNDDLSGVLTRRHHQQLTTGLFS